jgi:signal transduction histidine kinase
VQQIILGHGGRVEVQSGVAGRTVFRITLPRNPPALGGGLKPLTSS